MSSSSTTTFTIYTVTVRLGGIEISCSTTANVIAELHPEVFFLALQRVGSADIEATPADHLDADYDRIARDHSGPVVGMLQLLRAQMEQRQTPSMSVGDTVSIEGRALTFTHTCESVGWRLNVEPKETA